MSQTQFSLHAADFAVLALATTVSMSIGLYHAIAARRNASISTYLVGGKIMGTFSVTLSFVVTYLSSIVMLGVPTEMFVYGSTSVLEYLSLFVCNPLAAWIAVPLIHSQGSVSINEYLEKRYKSVAVRCVGSTLSILRNAFYMGAILYGPAVALESVARFPVWASVVIVGGVAIVYTSIGGFKAVVWTDCFQMVIMLIGLIAITVKAMSIVGFANFWNINVSGRRIRQFSFDPDPTVRTSFWGCFFGSAIFWFTLSFQQQTAQRVVSLPSQRQGKIVMLLGMVGYNILVVLVAMTGLAAYAFYMEKKCDPFEEGVIENANEVLPYFVMELFYEMPGLPGLFLASLFSASFSSLSSGWNSMSALTVEDFLLRLKPSLSEAQQIIAAKIFVVVYGLMSIGLCFAILNVNAPLSQICNSFTASVGGPFCALFILGCFFTATNWIGALSGVVMGICLTFWIAIGGAFHRTPWLPPAPSDGCFANSSSYNITSSVSSIFNETTWDTDFIIWTDTPSQGSGLSKLYSISYFWYATIGLVTSVSVGLLVSLITGRSKAEEIDPACISHIVRRLYYGDLDCSKNRSNVMEMSYAEEKEEMIKTRG